MTPIRCPRCLEVVDEDDRPPTEPDGSALDKIPCYWCITNDGDD
jgi:hypothetical protein